MVASVLCVQPGWHIFPPVAPFPAGDGVAMPAYCLAQTGEIVALKKVALRRLEDGIPNQALREIKALQEMEDNQYVSGTGGPEMPCPALFHSLCSLICFLTPHFLFYPLIHSYSPNYFIPSLFLFTHFSVSSLID